MLYGRKVWPLKESDITLTSRTDIQTMQWMYDVSLRDKKSVEKYAGCCQ